MLGIDFHRERSPNDSDGGEPTPSRAPGRGGFAALRHPNYRLWFWGQMVSLFGTWMQTTAQGYLIFVLTHSALYLGYAAFAQGVSIWLLMLYGGVIADRVPRRTLLIITQSSMMLLAFVLAALTFLHLVQAWHIIVLSFFLGVANAFDAPARQSFLLEMVDREDLTNAIALNSTMFNTATAIGPAAGGLAYAALGPGWCFMVNGFTFLAVIFSLARMKIKPMAQVARRTPALKSIIEGVRYVRDHSVIVAITAMVTVLSLFGISYGTLFPLWAVRILGGDATTNGFLQSFRGIGSLIGAFVIVLLGRFQFKGKMFTLGTFGFPISLVAFSFIRGLPGSAAVLLFAGAAQILILNIANALIQMETADEVRGRVMSVYMLNFFGFMPVGGLIAGALAASLTAPAAIRIGGVICLAAAIVMRWVAPRVNALP